MKKQSEILHNQAKQKEAEMDTYFKQNGHIILQFWQLQSDHERLLKKAIQTGIDERQGFIDRFNAKHNTSIALK